MVDPRSVINCSCLSVLPGEMATRFQIYRQRYADQDTDSGNTCQRGLQRIRDPSTCYVWFCRVCGRSVATDNWREG